jgi:hypothetical protein
MVHLAATIFVCGTAAFAAWFIAEMLEHSKKEQQRFRGIMDSRAKRIARSELARMNAFLNDRNNGIH